ncbi:BatA and WFA domain-containing protein [soil metagenome]
MRFLVPGALGLAALAGPLIVLYMLRSKRRPQEVTSTMLWREVGEPVSSAVPWKPLKLTPLLLAQLAVLGLFVLSLARPFVSEATVLGPHTVFVLDTSGSMAMAERFDQARAAALDLATDISEANLASVVEAGPRARVLVAFSADAQAVADAIIALTPGGGTADMSSAVRLARGLAAPDRDTSVVIFSDGGAGPLAEEPVIGALHLRFDDLASNVAISAFDAEPSAEGAVRTFIQIDNHGPDPREVTVAFDVDGLPAGRVEIAVPGLDVARQVVPLDAGSGSIVMARFVDHSDALVLDDRADLVVGGGSGSSVAVTGEGSPYLSALLASTPGVTVVDDPDDADVLIVDGGPLVDIDRPTWLIRPEEAPEGLELTGLERNLAVTFQRPGDPILDGVDLSSVSIAESQSVEGLTWLPVVASGQVPLVLLGDVEGYRVVYTTFDLVHSNLPVQVAFPILGSNLIQWLRGGEAGSVSAEAAGTPIVLVTPSGSRARVEMPTSEIRELAQDAGLFVNTEQPGIYHVSYVDEAGNVTAGETAVRRFVSSESVAPSRDIAVSAGPSGTSDEANLIREWAPWVIGLALVLLAVEWWIGHQRPGWRRSRESAEVAA